MNLPVRKTSSGSWRAWSGWWMTSMPWPGVRRATKRSVERLAPRFGREQQMGDDRDRADQHDVECDVKRAAGLVQPGRDHRGRAAEYGGAHRIGNADTRGPHP